jgi:ABC-type nitrate/sulfonate/bicarbonate transport system substrate-binding protein
MKVRFVFGALLVLAALTLGGCGSGESSGGLTKVTLMLNWTPNNHHAGIYAAREKGWYREAGIDLEIVEPAEAGADAVVGTGAADFGISQAESLLPARAAGAPVVSIGTLLPYDDSSLMSLASKGISRPRDLQGKKYGGYGGSLERELINTLVACDGGDPARVDFVEVGNIDYLAGMDQGRFDFVWVFEGWDALRARTVVGRPISTIKFVDHLNCIPDWYTPVIITNERMIKERPALVRKFMQATSRGYRFAIDDPAGAAQMLLRAAPELDAKLVEASAAYHAPKYAKKDEPWGIQEGAVWVRFEEFLRKAKLLEKPVDVQKAFTNDFIAR